MSRLTVALRLPRFFFLAASLIVGLGCATAWLPHAQATPLGNRYYVSPGGDDGNLGTLAQPFKTVQQCASVAQPGDTCYLRAGVYRETISPTVSGVAGQPITFTNYLTEEATISGADVLTTTWVLSSGQIYTAPMRWSLKSNLGGMAVDDQLWVDGQMLVTARWPNIPITKATYFTRSDLAIADGAYTLTTNTGVYTDAALSSFSTNFWQNAKLNVAPGLMWVNATCTISNSTNLTLDIYCPGLRFNDGAYAPRAANHYYLWGTLGALDAPGEWFRSGPANNGTLYAWLPNSDDPNTHLIEVKRRLWAFNLRNRAYINLVGLKIVGASLDTDNNTHHLTLQDLEIRHPWHFQEFPPGTGSMNFKGALYLRGTDNVLADSVLADSGADVLYIDGQNQRVQNNVFYNIAYMGAGLAIAGSHSTTVTTTNWFTQNTVFNVGAQAVYMAPYLQALYNDAYNTHALITDMGIFYAWGTNGRGAEIAYNYAHDTRPIMGGGFPSFFGGTGIYFDFASSDYVVHHNVTWNTNKAGILAFAYDHDPVAMNANPGVTNMNLKIYNNTLDGNLFLDVLPNTHMTGTAAINNLIGALSNTLPPSHTATYTHTYAFGLSNPGFFSDYAQHDYRLTSGPAIDYGTPLPPYTNGYTGAAPDAGAFEGLTQNWVAGALLRQHDLAALQVNCANSPSGYADCTVSHLPLGRKAPLNLAIRIGNTNGGGVCHNLTDYTTHFTTATCTTVPVNGNVLGQPLYVAIGGEWVLVQPGSGYWLYLTSVWR